MAKGRVLIVDDDADVRKSVRLVLDKAGYDVVEAEDGEQAIQQLQSGDNLLMLNVIISDLVMPKVSGMEAIPYFRTQFPGIPVVVLTGSRSVEDVSHILEYGIADYLLKPVESEKLLAAVEKARELPKTF